MKCLECNMCIDGEHCFSNGIDLNGKSLIDRKINQLEEFSEFCPYFEKQENDNDNEKQNKI